MSLLGKRQLETIGNYGNTRYRLHVGPFRCGKTYAAAIGLGEKLKNTKVEKFGYLLVGKTVQTIRNSKLKELETQYGDAVKFTKNSSVGTIFGHPVLLGGLNDKESVRRIQGMTFRGIDHDEAQLSSDDQFNLLQGRLSGESSDPVWYEALANPDAPTHHLKKKIDEGLFDYVHWTTDDAVWNGAQEYYDTLRRTYKDNPAYLDRYINGEWRAADGRVYMGFNEKYHVIPAMDLIGATYKYYKLCVDFGIHNPTAVLLVGVMPGGEHIVIREEYRRTTPEKEIVITELSHLIINMYNQCNGRIKGVYIDPSASALIGLLRQGGLNVIEAANDVEPGIAIVMDMMANDLLFISSACAELIGEMNTYARKPDGTIDKRFDHGPDALRYGVYTDIKKGGAA